MRKKRSSSGDRFLHDIVSTAIAGESNRRRDQPIDSGVKTHGSSHRDKFPHQSITQACAYLCLQDAVHMRKIDVITNTKVAAGHFFVDSLSPKLKEKIQMAHRLAGMIGKA